MRQRTLPDLSNAPSLRKWALQTAKLVSAFHSRPHTQKLLRILAADYRDRLGHKRRKSSATRWWRTEWRPKKRFQELPPFSQRKDLNVKSLVSTYYLAINAGLPPGHAELVGCIAWLLIFKKSISPRHFRRIISRVEKCGGPDLAPIEAYADAT